MSAQFQSRVVMNKICVQASVLYIGDSRWNTPDGHTFVLSLTRKYVLIPWIILTNRNQQKGRCASSEPKP